QIGREAIQSGRVVHIFLRLLRVAAASLYGLLHQLLEIHSFEAQKRLSFNHLNLTANDSSLTGHVQVTLAEQPEWQIDLQSSK
ncbi:hypothetical protein KU710_23685, partial [Salmonella enterica subsp. enterica serovar Give]|nr:hypothetical protein [Salmonella enterica subsp. enterica serovar Give]